MSTHNIHNRQLGAWMYKDTTYKSHAKAFAKTQEMKCQVKI